MRPAFATHAPPTGFWVVLPRPSRACAFVHARPFRWLAMDAPVRLSRLRTPILPWAFRFFSRACRMPFQRHVRLSMLVIEHRYTTNRRSRTFRLAAIRSWVFWRTVAGRALGLQSFAYRATEATTLPSPALQRVRAICA
jgi:hypothetical protein